MIARPATPDDKSAASTFDLQPDRWREGGNRRSFVATADDGMVLGHCRALDNEFHPTSRTFFMETITDVERYEVTRSDVEDALVSAQRGASELPLHIKVPEEDLSAIALSRRHTGVVVQLMPPWRFAVGSELRAWANLHRTSLYDTVVPAAEWPPTADVLDVYVEHYAAQHQGWSPAADRATLCALNADDFDDSSESQYDRERSVVLVAGGRITAQALVWPAEDGVVEVTVHAVPYENCSARDQMEACIAGVIDRSVDGAILLIDSHVTERVESAMMRDIRDAAATIYQHWGAIVAIPGRSGASPPAIPSTQIPAEAREFAAALNPHASGSNDGFGP